MGRYKNTPVLLLLLAALQVFAKRSDCPIAPDQDLTCYNDYDRNITCTWDAAREPGRGDPSCTLFAVRSDTTLRKRQYYSSCYSEPADASRPALRKCYLLFKRSSTFQSFHLLNITLRCKTLNLMISYKPACHVKLSPPGKPDINSTSISWCPQVKPRQDFNYYNSQLQWKKWDQSWSDPTVNAHIYQGNYNAELDPDRLMQGERYEARVRVTGEFEIESTLSEWSDWSPSTSWVSPVGTERQANSKIDGIVLSIIVLGAAIAVIVVVMVLKNDKFTWVYMVRKIRGPPLPDPAKSFLKDTNFQMSKWLSPHFGESSLCSPLKFEALNAVEVTSTITIYRPEAAVMLEKTRDEGSYESTRSSFSNPSYSKLCAPPPPPPPPLPFFLPATGNLGPFATHPPKGPDTGQGDGKTTEQDREEERRKAAEIQQLLSKGNSNTEQVQVMSDYEKVEKPPVERFRLQSLDSGVCSGEEVSHESLEADSIGVTDSHGEGNGKEWDSKKLFGGSGGVFGKGSILVCSDYEQVQMLQPGSPELPSLDSGVGSGSEEQGSHEESLDYDDKSAESTSIQFPPLPLSHALPFSLSAFPQPPLKLFGTGLGLALPSVSQSDIMGRMTSMSRSMEPSGSGYMPVKQEQS